MTEKQWIEAMRRSISNECPPEMERGCENCKICPTCKICEWDECWNQWLDEQATDIYCDPRYILSANPLPGN